MSIIRPFRGLRPRRDLAAKVACPPYDVLTSTEAREMTKDNEVSFLHVVRPEIDLEESCDPRDPRVYAQGARSLLRLTEQGVLIRDESPCFYIYQQGRGDHVQAGLAAGFSMDDYEADLIKKHEGTRADKEEDRTRHVDAVAANTGPVFLTHTAREEIDDLVDVLRRRSPEYDFVSEDEVRHTLWVVSAAEDIDRLVGAFVGVSHLYVADGHHRSAAGARVRDMRRAANPRHRGDEGYNYFLGVVFPHDQVRIMPYNRVIRDLAGMTEEEFIERVRSSFEVSPTESAVPDRPGVFGMFLGGGWYRLEARQGSYPERDPVRSLDCAILQQNLLAPLLGIEDPRSDRRIDFVGGIHGTRGLEGRCRAGWRVAFSLYPTNIEQLMTVADAGRTMPPKSTWFEPKLRSGLIVRSLEG